MLSTYLAIRAVQIRKQCGRYAASRFAAKHGVSSLYRLAFATGSNIMKVKDIFLAIAAITVYRIYWLNLSPEQRFIKRNKLEPSGE